MVNSRVNLISKGKTSSLLLFFLPYFFAVSLLALNILPYSSRNIVLISLTICMIIYARLKQYSAKQLGFTFSNFKSSMPIYFGYSLLIVLSMVLSYKFNLIRKPIAPEYNLFFIYYVFISCPCQEFLYRSVVLAEFRKIDIPNYLFVLLSAINYSYLHIFYHDWITLVATFIMGIIWGLMYVRYPNFYLIAFSHAVVGVVSMLVGIL